MYRIKEITYKFLFFILLYLPNVFYSILFFVAFPIYHKLHTKRAYGRVERHLASANNFFSRNAKSIINATEKNSSDNNCFPLQRTSARDMFWGIYKNAFESYRGLAHFKTIEEQIVYENEEIIIDAIEQCHKVNAPIAAISIHQGAFELLHRALCRYSKHVHLITDSVGDPAFRSLLTKLRSNEHLTEYHPENTGRLLRELFRTQGILAMVVDQGKHTKGNTVSLFGRPTTLYLRLPQKVNEMGAGIVTFRTWTEYSPEKKIIIRFEKYYPPKYDELQKKSIPLSIKKNVTHQQKEERSEKLDQSPLVTAISRDFEQWIAEHPEQWSWNYHGNFATTASIRFS